MMTVRQLLSRAADPISNTRAAHLRLAFCWRRPRHTVVGAHHFNHRSFCHCDGYNIVSPFDAQRCAGAFDLHLIAGADYLRFTATAVQSVVSPTPSSEA